MRRSGFTLIEMIFAITLMAITGGIVSSLLGKVYENYAIQQETSNLEFKSIQVLNQIEHYLKRSIPNSIMLHDGSTDASGNLDVYNEDAYTALLNIGYGSGNLDSNKTLIWLDMDIENLYGDGPQPNYNKWLNIKDSDDKKMISVDSKFGNIVDVQKNIFGTTNASPAIYYVYGNQQGTSYEKFYNKTNTTDLTAIFAIDQSATISDNEFSLKRKPDEIGEIFYVTGTGYGLSLENHNLYLIYNYQPWDALTSGTNTGNGETFVDGTKQLLMENVKSFEFWSEYDTMRMKICLYSNMNVDADNTDDLDNKASICKEKAIEVR
jgi:prepilin-type N-terminal cleavage/methylation domain-containing protein